ncbi:MAG TPA: transcriptional repressor LexA [Nitrospiria bacterium]|jgi:repressor LexA
METQPTKRQLEILKFLAEFVRKAGYPPSLREIAKRFRIKGISAVKKHLDALEEKGCLTRGRGARMIGVSDLPQSIPVPILGQVAAGRPILAQENISGTFALDRSVVRFRYPFLLKVKGDSMIGAGILEGDHVLVKSQPHAEDRDIVVALLGDEATVKRFFHRGNKVVLQPENPDQSPLVLTQDDDFRILGKVMGTVRFLTLN